MELARLSDFFNPDEIEVRVGATNKDKTKGIALFYITNRAIQNRLDEVCGKGNWRNDFAAWKDKAQLCGISILVDGQWVTKWDGAEDTQTEPVKGGLSGAMKRAGAQWGIGRYLYDIPNTWHEIVPAGKSYKFATTPKLPKEFLPAGVDNSGYLADVATDEDRELGYLFSNDSPMTEAQKNLLTDIIVTNHLDIEKVKAFYKLKALDDMTQKQFDDYVGTLKERMQGFQMPKAKPVLNVAKEAEQLGELNASLGARK